MTRTDRFESLDAFLAEKRRLKEKRDLHVDRIKAHWDALKHKEVRKNLASNAFHDLLGLWKPTRLIGSILGNGSIGTSLGLVFGSGKGGWIKRAGLFALGLVAPKLIQRFESISLEDITREVGVSIDHIRDHLRSRKQAPAARTEVDGEND